MMHNDYEDIRDKINEEPQWFDEFAVPRYCKFHPKEIANIYADECVLYLIACQSCGRKFRVVDSQDKMAGIKYRMMHDEPLPSLAQRIRRGSLHYGDPPNVKCCPAGPTMNCDDLKVLEYWHRHTLEWVRNKKLEIDLPDLVGEVNDGREG